MLICFTTNGSNRSDDKDFTTDIRRVEHKTMSATNDRTSTTMIRNYNDD